MCENYKKKPASLTKTPLPGTVLPDSDQLCHTWSSHVPRNAPASVALSRTDMSHFLGMSYFLSLSKIPDNWEQFRKKAQENTNVPHAPRPEYQLRCHERRAP